MPIIRTRTYLRALTVRKLLAETDVALLRMLTIKSDEARFARFVGLKCDQSVLRDLHHDFGIS